MARPSPASERSSERSEPTEQSVLARLGLAVLVSGLCGVLVAGLALPLVGAVGLGAKAASDDFMGLPSDLDLSPPASRSRILAADGSLLATFYAVDRIPTNPKLVPSVMKKAIVSIEDSRFYEHDGIDVKGTFRAAVTNAKSGRVAQGGSTLTQQYVKNLLIEQAAGNKEAEKAARAESADRKLREARYALALEKKLTKDEILHGYLDIAYFGNGVYGIGAAANFYFRKPVQKLALTEAAELAGMVQNPNRFNPLSDKARPDVLNRRNTVLGRMRDLGYLTQKQHDVAVKAALPRVTGTKTPRYCDAPGVSAPFYCDYVLKELLYTDVGSGLGADATERRERLFRGGLVIRTSLDPVVQKAAQDAVDDKLPRNDPSGAITASDVVEPGTGHIKAMAVDRTYGPGKGKTTVNYADGGSKGFQPGSTYKMFTLAAALTEGLPVKTSFYSPSTYTSKVFKSGSEQYTLSNAGDSESGTFNLRTGTEDSVNTFYIQLAERVGLNKIYSLAEAMGVRTKTGRLTDKANDRTSAAGVIGTFEVSPLSMAGAYASLAAHGSYCPPRAVLSITSVGGEIDVPENACRQVLEPGVADTVTDILEGVITSGTARKNGQLGRPAAGKTGTTNESTAAWFVGYTPQLATAVWVGRPDPKTGGLRKMTRKRIGGQYYSQMYGGDLPTQIWRQTMREALQDQPVERFDRADPDVVDGKQITVPDTSGVTYDEAVRRLKEAGLSPTRGRRVSSQLPEGVVTYTYPAAGDQVELGKKTYIYTSTGRTYVAPRRTYTQAPQAPAAPAAPAQPRSPGAGGAGPGRGN